MQTFQSLLDPNQVDCKTHPPLRQPNLTFRSCDEREFVDEFWQQPSFSPFSRPTSCDRNLSFLATDTSCDNNLRFLLFSRPMSSGSKLPFYAFCTTLVVITRFLVSFSHDKQVVQGSCSLPFLLFSTDKVVVTEFLLSLFFILKITPGWVPRIDGVFLMEVQ